ncbi:MAG: TetR/AcrR family transcriptional regulator [bacterium]|nr:TetR/AcrR family transcriptional regulator [bacterium]
MQQQRNLVKHRFHSRKIVTFTSAYGTGTGAAKRKPLSLCQMAQSAHDCIDRLMEMDRTQGQSKRIRRAIEEAFQSLLREKNYETITIGEIASRAEVGRSTFYRYFETKTDLLIALHENMFTRLNLGMMTRTEWLSDAPPKAMIDFLARLRHMERSSPAYYMLSRDFTFSREMTVITQRVTLILSQQVESGLRQAFAGTESRVPLSLLAQTIIGIYMSIFQWWLTQQPTLSPEHAAQHVQWLIRAVVREAFTKEN